MKKFNDAPHGVTEARQFQNGRGLPNASQPTGWRKPTAALANSEQLAQAGERVSVPKSKAFVSVKRVGAHIGLKASDMMLLDTLGAFTQAQDWEEGRRPIVWASNAYLMEQTGFSLSALKRHARRLAEAGVIAFKDSPNGKRWGRRDADSVIIEAYGFDLAPLSARVEEFEQLYIELKAERELCQRLKRQITVSRRMIRAQIEAALTGGFAGPWTQFSGLFEDLLEKLPRRYTAAEVLERLLSWFKELQERVERSFLRESEVAEVVDNADRISGKSLEKTHVLNPTGVIFEPHILITKQLNPVTSNSSEQEKTANVVADLPPEERVDKGLEEWVAETHKLRGAALDLPTVMQACPEFASWAHNLGGYLKDWGDLYRVAGQLRPMIGVSEHAWHVAQDRLGKQLATAALVLVFEKHCAGEVASPGGYLRGMVEKAGAGELHLERSYYGRLSGQAA
jgi:replication initiation protein RepC